MYKLLLLCIMRKEEIYKIKKKYTCILQDIFFLKLIYPLQDLFFS